MRLKTISAIFVFAFALTTFGTAQNNSAALEAVLKKMDSAAVAFHTTEADFEWDQFTRVIGSTDTQTGKDLLPPQRQKHRDVR